MKSHDLNVQMYIFVDQHRPLLLIFDLFHNNLTEKIEGFSRIWTGIVEVEGEQADHLPPTTAPIKTILMQRSKLKIMIDIKALGMLKIAHVWSW